MEAETGEDVSTSQGGLAYPDHQQGALGHSVSGPQRVWPWGALTQTVASRPTRE